MCCLENLAKTWTRSIQVFAKLKLSFFPLPAIFFLILLLVFEEKRLLNVVLKMSFNSYELIPILVPVVVSAIAVVVLEKEGDDDTLDEENSKRRKKNEMDENAFMDHTFSKKSWQHLSQRRVREKWEGHFRFQRDEVIQLAAVLFPGTSLIKIPHVRTISRTFAVLIYLKRMAFPSRLSIELEEFFDLDPSSLSKIINHVRSHIDDNFSHCLRIFNHPNRSSIFDRHLSKLVESVSVKTDIPVSELPVYGFIDGIRIGICTPLFAQQEMYSRYFGGHTMNGLGLVLPNGLLIDFFGPKQGSWNDINLWDMSGLSKFHVFYNIHFHRYRCVFGDNVVIGANEKRVSIFADQGFCWGEGSIVNIHFSNITTWCIYRFFLKESLNHGLKSRQKMTFKSMYLIANSDERE